MKRLVTISVALLLAGCTSKREICANWEAADISFVNKLDNAMAYRKKLGIQTPVPMSGGKISKIGARNSVSSYCRFYKN